MGVFRLAIGHIAHIGWPMSGPTENHIAIFTTSAEMLGVFTQSTSHLRPPNSLIIEALHQTSAHTAMNSRLRTPTSILAVSVNAGSACVKRRCAISKQIVLRSTRSDEKSECASFMSHVSALNAVHLLCPFARRRNTAQNDVRQLRTTVSSIRSAASDFMGARTAAPTSLSKGAL